MVAQTSAGFVALIEKVMSGGQTGADRAALDFGIEHGIPHGGWCPRGARVRRGQSPPAGDCVIADGSLTLLWCGKTAPGNSSIADR